MSSTQSISPHASPDFLAERRRSWQAAQTLPRAGVGTAIALLVTSLVISLVAPVSYAYAAKQLALIRAGHASPEDRGLLTFISIASAVLFALVVLGLLVLVAVGAGAAGRRPL